MPAFVTNRKAHFNFEILEKLEAGIELIGLEVKSVKAGQANLEGAHIIVRGHEAFLVGATITPYQAANTPADYDPARNRRLLLTKKELAAFASQESQKGLTIVPLSMYSKARKIKLEIAIVRGKKKFDKRQTMKERDSKRHIDRTLKNQ
jgi:SsrA-binding protein